MEKNTVLVGNNMVHLAEMPDNSVDAIVTDPPYGLSFMGKKWDYDVPAVDIWRECFRVLKPGGHLLAFAGTRTQHRMAVNIEDAGFEIRDMIAWVYGSGFPKSLDISKALDKMAGAEREVIGLRTDGRGASPQKLNNHATGDTGIGHADGSKQTYYDTAPATDAAKQWEGWGTALKPALEPITVARKPLTGTVAENVLQWGTGGINVDGCRVPTAELITNHSTGEDSAKSKGKYGDSSSQVTHQTDGQKFGRFPANFIHDGSDEVMELFPMSNGQQGDLKNHNKHSASPNGIYGKFGPKFNALKRNDFGSAARFFYTAKASASERGKDNTHPTVKPLALMRYLVRLVTPPGGLVYDPFAGSGTTIIAAILEGFEGIGSEMEVEYVEIANKRIKNECGLFINL